MKFVTVILAILLVTTNAYWIYHTIDTGVTLGYTQISLRENQQALAQALRIINVSKPAATSSEIFEAAHSSGTTSEPFEKDGYF